MSPIPKLATNPALPGASRKTVSERRRSRHEVTRLIDRLRKLVAQQRSEGEASSPPPSSKKVEIDRLQRRLAIAVKRELRH